MSKFETAATYAARSILHPLARNDLAREANREATREGETNETEATDNRSEPLKKAEEAVPSVQVTIKSGMNMMAFRELTPVCDIPIPQRMGTDTP